MNKIELKLCPPGKDTDESKHLAQLYSTGTIAFNLLHAAQRNGYYVHAFLDDECVGQYLPTIPRAVIRKDVRRIAAARAIDRAQRQMNQSRR